MYILLENIQRSPISTSTIIIIRSPLPLESWILSCIFCLSQRHVKGGQVLSDILSPVERVRRDESLLKSSCVGSKSILVHVSHVPKQRVRHMT